MASAAFSLLSIFPSNRTKKERFVVHGTVAPGFEPVREVFAEHFRRGVEADAQCCAYIGEEKVHLAYIIFP